MQGPPGPAGGSEGIEGPIGPQGPQGVAGSTSLSSSENITVGQITANSMSTSFVDFNDTWRIYHNAVDSMLELQYNDATDGWVKKAVLAELGQ
jgi:hypothetical protein